MRLCMCGAKRAGGKDDPFPPPKRSRVGAGTANLAYNRRGGGRLGVKGLEGGRGMRTRVSGDKVDNEE